MEALSKAEFISAVESLDYYTGNTDAGYLAAVWEFANDYALNNWDDVEHILGIAADCYRGQFTSRAAYAESVCRDRLGERVERIERVAKGSVTEGPWIEVDFDWDTTAINMESTYGWNFSSYQDHYFTEAP